MTTKEKASTKTAAHAKQYPVQLATVTDLTLEEVHATTEAVNPLIADAFALYVKYKNFHWHLTGSHFRDYHLLFDEHAAQILGSIDLLAERVRRIGGTTIRSISHINQLQSVQDNNSGFVAPAEMIHELMQDNAHTAQKYRESIDVIEKKRDFATSNLLEELLDQAELRKWFLFEILQGESNTM